MTRAKTRPFESVSPRVRRGAAPAAAQCAPGPSPAPSRTGREPLAGSRARARSLGGPTRERTPGPRGAPRPSPSRRPARLQARDSHVSRYPPGPRGSRPVSPGSPRRGPDPAPAAALCANAPGTRPGPGSRDSSSPRGTENNGR